jgi:hypothetical protein
MFPEHQTGLDLFGATYAGDYRIGYHATLSNGRSPTEANNDVDSKVAFGGRLELEAPLAGTLKLGASFYTGRYTNLPPTVGAVPESYDEHAFGADAQWDRGGVHAQGELVFEDRAYRAGQRTPTIGGFVPDGRSVGYYGLAGYRFASAWNIMPFAMSERYLPVDKAYFAGVFGYSVGVNFRPTATVVLKASVGQARFEGGAFDGVTISITSAQAAWVF